VVQLGQEEMPFFLGVVLMGGSFELYVRTAKTLEKLLAAYDKTT
jgi:hypothetical protein